MSMAEVKESVAEMTIEESLEVAAFIAHLNRSQDAEYQAELDRRMAAMDAGCKSSSERLDHLHEELYRKEK